MNEPLKSRKSKPDFEIHWNIREIFSETALDSFCDEIKNKRDALRSVRNK